MPEGVARDRTTPQHIRPEFIEKLWRKIKVACGGQPGVPCTYSLELQVPYTNQQVPYMKPVTNQRPKSDPGESHNHLIYVAF